MAQANSDLTTIKIALAKFGLKPGPINAARDRRAFDAVRSFQAILGHATTGTLTAAQRTELYRRASANGVTLAEAPISPSPAAAKPTSASPASPVATRNDTAAAPPSRPMQVAGVAFRGPRESYQALARQFHDRLEDTDADLIIIEGANIDTDGGVRVTLSSVAKDGGSTADSRTMKGTVHNLLAAVDGRDQKRALLRFVDASGIAALDLIGRRHETPEKAMAWARDMQSRLDRLAVGAGLGSDPHSGLKSYRR